MAGELRRCGGAGGAALRCGPRGTARALPKGEGARRSVEAAQLKTAKAMVPMAVRAARAAERAAAGSAEATVG